MGVGFASYVLETAPLDPRDLWRWLKAAVVLAMALIVVRIGFALFEFAIDTFDTAPNPGDWFWLVYEYTYYAAAAVYFASFVLLIWLTYRLARNLHGLKAAAPLPSPTAAASYYLAPFLNIYMPALTMSRIWDRTSQLAQSSEPSRAGWWWALWMVSILFSGAANGATSDYAVSIGMEVAGLCLALAAYALELRLFGRLAQMQRALIVRAPRQD